MNQKRNIHIAVLAIAACLQTASAQLGIPSDGSDGDLNVTDDRVIDLSLATPGLWDGPSSGNGIYDSNKWAVVFKYRSVNIPGIRDVRGGLTGYTVTFKNHPSRAPVVWLVQSNVFIDGKLVLRGEDGHPGPAALIPAEPGPGGFRGGPYGPQGAGAGLGPGGGGQPSNLYAGSHASQYGHPSVLPLIGGSGASTGGAGGGSILIAAAGSVRVDGQVVAAGGETIGSGNSGAAGAVRIIASQLLGTGEIYCLRDGRIRIEAFAMAPTVQTAPETIAVPPAAPPIIWPPDNAPTVRIVSIDSVPAPPDPTAPLISAADIAIQNNDPVAVELETQNFPIEGAVELRFAYKWGKASWLRAAYVSGDQARATWRVTNSLNKGFTTLQARVTAP